MKKEFISIYVRKLTVTKIQLKQMFIKKVILFIFNFFIVTNV